MKTALKLAALRHLNTRNARVVYLAVAIVALILGAGAPDAFGIGGGGGGG
jgi:hypothetical protein